jgi:TPR repeat protein
MALDEKETETEAEASELPKRAKRRRKKQPPRPPRWERTFQIVGVLLAVILLGAGLYIRNRRRENAPITSEDSGPRLKCAHGDGPACLTVGAAYEHGTGVPVDLAEARAYYQKAGCEHRDALRVPAGVSSAEPLEK